MPKISAEDRIIRTSTTRPHIILTWEQIVKGSIVIVSLKHGLKTGILLIIWFDRSLYFFACVIYNPRRRKMCVAFFEIVLFWSTFWAFKNQFYILDTIEGMPKSHPILISTEVEPVALPKIVWNGEKKFTLPRLDIFEVVFLIKSMWKYSLIRFQWCIGLIILSNEFDVILILHF